MSAQKLCPKCGEKNPAEAVMCWACYTSLTGAGIGATTLAGAGPSSLGDTTSSSDTGEKKKIDPKHLAIIGVGLLVAVGFGVNTMMGSSDGGDEGLLPSGGDVAPTGQPSSNPQPQIIEVPSGLNPVGPSPPSLSDVKDATKIPYTMISAPNLRYAGATVVIVPTQNNVSAGQAKALATVAHKQILQRKKFSPVEIFVFNDVASAQTLAAYQTQRRGAPLTPSDYANRELVPAWKNVLIRQRTDKNRTAYTFPQTSPTSFWVSDNNPR